MSALPGRPPYVTQAVIDEAVGRALDEDAGAGDVTSLSTIPAKALADAVLIAREEGVLAGVEVAIAVFKAVDPTIEVSFEKNDGNILRPNESIASIRGPARGILTGERTALNFLQRMSGIATATSAMVDAVKPHKSHILDTRKTAPGLRLLDKWAVYLGGGRNHRIGLFDMILIKENHIAAAGGIPYAIEAARAWIDQRNGVSVEIETRSLEEVQEVLRTGGVDVILLDNMVKRTASGFDVELLARAVSLIDGRHATEASGNVTLDSVNAIASTGVDFISSGSLTHSVRALDLSLMIRTD